METLEDRIQNILLTKTDKKIAEYILEHKDTMGIETVTMMAKNIGTSDTSIIRFLRNLGYKGFSDFKKKMADRMIRQYKESRENMSPGEKYVMSSGLLQSNNVITDVIEKTVDNIHTTFRDLNPAVLQKVADVLIKSERKFIIGFRSSASCSVYMSRKMVNCLPNVFLLDKADSYVLEQLVDLTKNDSVLLYSFSRYSKITYTIIEMAKEVGATVILITDKVTGPLAHMADIVISSKVGGVGVTNSYIVPLCISEILILLISKKMKPKDKGRVKRLDSFITREEMY